MSKRRQHAHEFKGKVELASRFGVHPTIVHQWKRTLLATASRVFRHGDRKKPEIDAVRVKKLYAKLDELAAASSFFAKAKAFGGGEPPKHWNAINGVDGRALFLGFHDTSQSAANVRRRNWR
ncbi:transposase [Paracoccus sp. R86501]|uniref:transposase n=1 Tax=Paracoccus sp. R86501 TaxID=3101711 RepID=UPI00366C25BF